MSMIPPIFSSMQFRKRRVALFINNNDLIIQQLVYADLAGKFQFLISIGIYYKNTAGTTTSTTITNAKTFHIKMITYKTQERFVLIYRFTKTVHLSFEMYGKVYHFYTTTAY